MNFWVVVGIVVICLLCSLAASADESANAAKAAAKKIADSDDAARMARRVSAFQLLLSEEFPEDSSKFTFAAADQAYKVYFQVFLDPRNRSRFSLLDAKKFKTDADRRVVVEEAISRSAAVFSEEFRRKVLSTVDGRLRFERAVLSAETRAG